MMTAGEPPSSQSSPLIELPDPEMLPEMDDEEVVVVVGRRGLCAHRLRVLGQSCF